MASSIRLIIILSTIFMGCCKEANDFTTSQLLCQKAGWKVTAVLSKDSSRVLVNNPSYPIIYFRFNNDSIDGNLEGKYHLLDEQTIRYHAQLDTNYWPYPQVYYSIYNITKNEHTATIRFYGFKQMEFINDSVRLHFELF
jgi:hypothetical protein